MSDLRLQYEIVSFARHVSVYPTCRKPHDPMFISFDSIPGVTDRKTDRRTDRHDAYVYSINLS